MRALKIAKTCSNCRYFTKFAEIIGFCRKYGFEISIKLAKETCLCKDFEMHHAMPKGNLTPIKRRIQ